MRGVIILLLLGGCATSPPTRPVPTPPPVSVPAPAGFSTYCSMHPDRLECSKP